MKQLLSILLILSHLITAAEVKQNTDDPLLNFIKMQEQFPTEIQQWEFTIKEKITTQEAYQAIVNQWKKEATHVVREGHAPGSVIHRITKEYDAINVTKQLITSEENPNTAERIIVITGEDFNADIEKEYLSLQSHLLDTVKKENTRTYTCLKFVDDGTIDSSVVLTKYLTELGVIHSETQNETVENSTIKNEIYGYTPLWSQYYSVDGQPYNLQMAVTNKGNDRFEYTIGTPILISEY